jgi:hypothetical protein
VNFKELHPMSQTTSQIGMGHHTGFGHGGPSDHSEGSVARMIEEQTARLPSDVFLWAAGASIVGSLALKLSGRDHESLFVGQWAPTLLILGLYNKIVKLAGSDPYRS